MRYLLLALVLLGCGPVIGEDKPAPKKLTYTEQVAKFEATVAGLSETVGNTNGELEAVKQELNALKLESAEVKRGMESLQKLLTVSESKAEAVPQASAPKAAGILFNGKPIDLSDWLSRKVVTVEVVGDVDKHLRDHGLEGDFSGLSRADRIRLHSVAHSYGTPLKSTKPPVVMNAAIITPRYTYQSSGCANGNCARGFGWFGRRR